MTESPLTAPEGFDPPGGDPWGPDPKHPLTRIRDAMLLTASAVALVIAAFYGMTLIFSGDTQHESVAFNAEWTTVVRGLAPPPGGASLESDRATAATYREFCRDAETRGVDPDPALMAAWVAVIEQLNRNVRDQWELWQAPDRWHRDLSPKP